MQIYELKEEVRREKQQTSELRVGLDMSQQQADGMESEIRELGASLAKMREEKQRLMAECEDLQDDMIALRSSWQRELDEKDLSHSFEHDEDTRRVTRLEASCLTLSFKRWEAREAGKAYRLWREVGAVHRARAQKARGALARWRKFQLSRAFITWSEACAEIRQFSRIVDLGVRR